MADTAHDLFDEFKGEGLGRIERCISEQQKETLYIDFKQNIDKENRPTSELTEDGRRLLSENISAFANSGGGVLVWGIRDRGHCAEKKIPIPNVDGFVVQLYRATQQATAPPMAGVEHISIVESEGAGYAVTYVPDGKAKPYMAVQTTDQYTYFMRSGGSTKPMPDVLVRALVLAGTRPSLKVRTKVVGPMKLCPVELRLPNGRSSVRPGIEVTVGLTLVNDGSALVELPAIALEKIEGYKYPSIISKSETTLELETGTCAVVLYRLGHSDPTYPGTSVNLHTLSFKVESEGVGTPYIHAKHDFTLRYWVYARNFSESGTIFVPRGDVKAM